MSTSITVRISPGQYAKLITASWAQCEAVRQVDNVLVE